MPPGPRAGFSMCVHKKRALLFGGVVDMEMEGHYFTIYLCFSYLLTDSDPPLSAEINDILFLNFPLKKL